MNDCNLDKSLALMTVREFLEIIDTAKDHDEKQEVGQSCSTIVVGNDDKKYVYGIDGIARLFGCSKPTANRIKKSGKIDAAITQIGRKIIVDAEEALKLAGMKTRGRVIKR